MSERTYGIDVSSHKKWINWSKVRQLSATQFAIVKATEGNYFEDEYFKHNWTGTRNEGLIRGAYHFFAPKIDPIQQANHFMRQLGDTLQPGDFPPVVDIEWWPKYIQDAWKKYEIPERIDRIQRFVDRVERDTGRVPMIYTSAHSWQVITHNSRRFIDYPLWVANYRDKNSNPSMPANNWGGNGWKIWQFSETGRVAGVGGVHEDVDENWFNGSYQDLLDFVKGKPPTTDKLSKLTNGEVNAIFQELSDKLDVGHTTLLSRTSLRYIANDSVANDRYDGPPLAEMNLNDAEKELLTSLIDEKLDSKGATTFPAWYTNQDVINVFYDVAEELILDGWHLIEQAGLQDIVIDRGAIYSGPEIDALTLNDDAKTLLKATIGIAPPPFDAPAMNGPYPGLTNQKMINAFYNAAPPFPDEYWRWIERAGLTTIAIPNSNRSRIYSGPKIEELPGLTDPEKEMLLRFLFG